MLLLAYISGYTKEFKQRSLLCAIEGFITYIVKVDVEFRGLSYIWTFLKNFFPLPIVYFAIIINITIFINNLFIHLLILLLIHT